MKKNEKEIKILTKKYNLDTNHILKIRWNISGKTEANIEEILWKIEDVDFI